VALTDHGASGAGRVHVPTAYLHGRHDPVFADHCVAATARYVTAPFRSVRLDAGHWLPEQRPDAVADAVLDLARRDD
jgi:pimeloyl-ACP methyl ester carboxylesterase